MSLTSNLNILINPFNDFFIAKNENLIEGFQELIEKFQSDILAVYRYSLQRALFEYEIQMSGIVWLKLVLCEIT